MNFLDYVWFDNNLDSYLYTLIVFVVLVVVFSFVQKFILYRLSLLAKKTNSLLDDKLIEVFRKIKPAFYILIAFYIAIQGLVLPPQINLITKWLLFILLGYQVIIILQSLIDHLFSIYIAKQGDNGTNEALKTVSLLVKISLWVVVGLFVLSNLGVNVTSAMAGLGIGGVAIALAVQNILGDLFSSFAIYFDKPFVVGDFIVVGDKVGTVEKIGIKTTRLRALQGEEIVISNKELTSSQIQNFKKMSERRVVFKFRVTYNTTTENLRKIPNIITGILSNLTLAKLDRVHFATFADSVLIFEVVYFVKSSDYNDYMNVQQEFNLQLKDELENIKVEMAYPTQTIYLANQS